MSSFTAVADVVASSAAKAGADNPADATTKSSERVDRVFIFAPWLCPSQNGPCRMSFQSRANKGCLAAFDKGAASPWDREFLEARLISLPRVVRIFHPPRRGACLRRTGHNLRGDGIPLRILECLSRLRKRSGGGAVAIDKKKSRPKGRLFQRIPIIGIMSWLRG